MSAAIRTKNGVRVRRLRTYPHRWGEGNVHALAWRSVTREDYHNWTYVSPSGKAWVFACALKHAHGREIDDGDDPSPVTCKRCLASGLVPAAWLPSSPSTSADL